MRSSLLLLFVAIGTAGANGDLNEVVTYGDVTPGGQATTPTRYKAPHGEAMLDGVSAAAWAPGAGTKTYGDTVDVVVAHVDHKVFLVLSPDQGKRSTLPLSLELADVDPVATSFDERPKHELLVWVHGKRDAASEAYLLAWDRSKHQAIVDKHWTGATADAVPAWAKP